MKTDVDSTFFKNYSACIVLLESYVVFICMLLAQDTSLVIKLYYFFTQEPDYSHQLRKLLTGLESDLKDNLTATLKAEMTAMKKTLTASLKAE